MNCDHASFCGCRGWKTPATDAVIAPDADALGRRESQHTPARSGMLLSTFVASPAETTEKTASVTGNALGAGEYASVFAAVTVSRIPQ